MTYDPAAQRKPNDDVRCQIRSRVRQRRQRHHSAIQQGTRAFKSTIGSSTYEEGDCPITSFAATVMLMTSLNCIAVAALLHTATGADLEFHQSYVHSLLPISLAFLAWQAGRVLTYPSSVVRSSAEWNVLMHNDRPPRPVWLAALFYSRFGPGPRRALVPTG